MNQMERRLSIIVAGQLIGKIKLQLNSNTTIIEGGGIISTGEYSMNAEEIEEMLYKRMEYYRKVAREDIEIKYS